MSVYLFKYQEAIPINYRVAFPAEFGLTATTTQDILILRLLTANIDIYSIKANKTIKLDKNYLAFPAQQVSRKSTKQLREFFDSFTFADYIRFSNKYYSRNLSFYNNILSELTYFYSYSSEGQHQAAFVNLYRILEYVSYSFPLIHASNFGNYIGTFEAFRTYFTDTKSELTFFEKFIKNLYRGTPYLALTTDFEFSNPDLNIANNCYDAFHRLSSDWVGPSRAIHQLPIENQNLIKLFKDTRNRYFHFAIGSGQKNIQNTDLKDPDFFFEKINSKFLNWIAYVYGTVIKESLDNALL